MDSHRHRSIHTRVVHAGHASGVLSLAPRAPVATFLRTGY